MRQKLTALIALGTAACTGWRPQSGPLPNSLAGAQARRKEIKVGLRNGGYVLMISPRLEGDSIIGYSPCCPPTEATRVAVATAGVARIYVHGFDVARTAKGVGLAIGVSLLVIAVSFLLLLAVCIATGGPEI